MLTLNISSKYVTLGLSTSQEEFLKYTLGRQILVFAILWMGTRDIVVALILTCVFILFADYLFNDNSNNKDDGIIPLSIESDLELLESFVSQMSEEDILKADFDLDSHFFYGIFDKNELVAVLASYCYKGKEPFESLSILVSPEARGKGYGKRLLSHLINEVKLRQRTIRYRVNIENTPSIKLCQSFGFEAYSRQRVFTPE